VEDEIFVTVVCTILRIHQPRQLRAPVPFNHSSLANARSITRPTENEPKTKPTNQTQNPPPRDENAFRVTRCDQMRRHPDEKNEANAPARPLNRIRQDSPQFRVTHLLNPPSRCSDPLPSLPSRFMPNGESRHLHPLLHARLITVIVATSALAILILRHARGIDGPWYAHAGWHHAPARQIWPAMALCAIPLIAGIWVYERFRLTLLAIAWVMISVTGFTLTCVTHLANEFSWEPMIRLIENPVAISYFADAARLTNSASSAPDRLRHYPQLMPQMYLHSQEKPPGPVLYYATFIHFFGPTDRAAFIAGITLACIIPFGVAATFWLARVLGAAPRESFYAAVALALMPSLNLFFPSFDPAYVIASCALLGSWALAMKQERIGASIAFGAILSLVVFIAYNLLVLGAVIVALGWILPPRSRRIRVFLNHCAIALVTFTAIYLILYLITGFDPIATFSTALSNQSRLSANWYRPYPWTILFDLSTFLLGAGWIAALLVLFYVARPVQLRRDVVIIGIIQIVLVAVTGLLPAETDRVWAFMTPLVAIPAGAELARWKPVSRVIALGCMFVILALLAQNLIQTFGAKAPLVTGR